MPRNSLTIVGGGFAGSILAVQLAHLPGGPYATDIHLVEPRSVPGPGLAYSTTRPEHLLNVRAGALSAFPDQPTHFTDWLQQTGVPACPHGFCSRQTYGRYLQELLAGVLAAPARNGLRFCWHPTTAIAAQPLPEGRGAAVQLATGQVLESSRVVLALGNFAPAVPWQGGPTDGAAPRFHANPWASDVLQQIAPNETVLLIGSGLTAVDVVLSLRAVGHQGAITVVSGHGRWPSAHGSPEACYPEFYQSRLLGLSTVAAVLRVVREEVARAAASGQDWRPVLDALRPYLGAIWAAWPLIEQSRFLRHLAPLWTVLRHRSPPQNSAALADMLATGQLRQQLGRVQRVETHGAGLQVTVRHQGQVRLLAAHHAISCTGPLLDYFRIADPLVAQMRAQGLLVPDALRLGLQTDTHGALQQADGSYSPVFYTLGASRRPQSFESTAVPEVRQQVAALVTQLQAALQLCL